jgi:hypothetical protein
MHDLINMSHRWDTYKASDKQNSARAPYPILFLSYWTPVYIWIHPMNYPLIVVRRGRGSWSSSWSVRRRPRFFVVVGLNFTLFFNPVISKWPAAPCGAEPFRGVGWWKKRYKGLPSEQCRCEGLYLHCFHAWMDMKNLWVGPFHGCFGFCGKVIAESKHKTRLCTLRITSIGNHFVRPII